MQAACVGAIADSYQTPSQYDSAPVDGGVDGQPYVQWRAAWTGAEVLANSWSVYSGATMSIFGDIAKSVRDEVGREETSRDETGWRVRVTGGYGQYSYRRWINGVAGREYRKFIGHKTFSDVLFGYQMQWNRLTFKAFGGLTAERHIVDPRDPENPVTGFSYGGKAALEAWLAISERHWLAADLAWDSAFETVRLGTRTGYRVFDNVDLGIEARFEGNQAFDAGRVGVLATWKFGDVALSGTVGVSGDRDMRTSPYGTVNLFYRY
jgi:hypothetical protein